MWMFVSLVGSADLAPLRVATIGLIDSTGQEALRITSLLRSLQAQTLPNEALPMG